jgi:hypothetical protein
MSLPPPTPAPSLPPAAGPTVEPALQPASPPEAARQQPPAQPARPPEPRTMQAEPFGKPAGAKSAERAEAEPKVTAAPAAKQRTGNGEARGWVADLLRRASSDDEESAPAQRPEGAEAGGGRRSPAQVVDSLNSLSIDIARAIDHEASVELWDRYKRGERNVFTRRLYTLQGQKTFDELRRKYERDADFRRAVDNYIGDFERLLAQVSKDDTDPAVSRMYLTSDTGKVYTMLAHAAGRLS